MDKKLGFGFMRLPLLDALDQTSFDMETLNGMVDVFLKKGFTYFDTAFNYHDFHSEKALRESLVKRYNRDSFQIATKMPMREFDSKEGMEKIFNQQLTNCGVEYFDYYMLHNIGVVSYKKAKEFDSFGFGFQKKEEGKIRSFGMSFHDSPELLDEILTAYPQLDFVQLQINYIDWENPGIQSRRCHEIARKHGKPIIVMEPLKGGNLAVVPKKAEQIMKVYDQNASVPSWGIRYAAGKEGVFMVLSGMNTMDQILDNMSYMDDFQPLNEEEMRIIDQVTGIINEDTAVDCTTCRYCVKECPQNIPIPDYFALYNSSKRASTKNLSSQFVYYLNLAADHGRAKDCIECKKCEAVCPQHLEIARLMRDVSELFDKEPAFPSRGQAKE